ncbi:MAG: hypothetical protein II625_03760 [Bacilli bacterium]|nr:hypothetical protein [Bacilli bacterium]
MEYKEKRDIDQIKKSLSDQLLKSLRLSGNNALDALLYSGYSYEEITELLTSYNNVSGLDLINCNDVIEKTLSK